MSVRRLVQEQGVKLERMFQGFERLTGYDSGIEIVEEPGGKEKEIDSQANGKYKRRNRQGRK